MNELSGTVMFSVSKASYFWEDILRAAQTWGDWSELELQVRKGLACQKKIKSEDLEDEILDPEKIDLSAADFRYARNLITAEEMEAWLTERGLTVEDWMDYIERSILLKTFGDQLDQILLDYPISPEEVQEMPIREGLFSGRLDKVCHKLAGRAAVYDVYNTSPEALPVSDSAALLDQFESAFLRFHQERISPEGIAENIKLHSMDWIKLHLKCLTFPQEQMAREAVLCITIDQRSPEEIASETNADFWQKHLYLDEVDAEWRSNFLSAKPHDLLGPFRSGENYLLYYVQEKVVPSIQDPELQKLAEENLLAKLVDREINERVKWHKLQPQSAG